MFRTKPKFFYKKCFLSTILLPLSWLYSLCFFFLNLPFFKGAKVSKKTICVGNIVVGGSGKTPICLALGKFLKKHHDICFITKGYGRETEKNMIIPHMHKNLFSPKEVGDEALLLSDVADVFVVNERDDAKCKDYDVAICDDGFFDNTIAKDCNIAVFDGSFFIGNGRTLPAGPLRFTMKSLKKADIAIIANYNETNVYEQMAVLEKYIGRDRILLADIKVKSKHNKDKKYFAFSGIGENSKFLNTLKNANLQIVGHCNFEDHSSYDKKKLKFIKEKMLSSKAEKIITTSKDYVKLPATFIEENEVEVLEIEYEIKNIDVILNFTE